MGDGERRRTVTRKEMGRREMRKRREKRVRRRRGGGVGQGELPKSCSLTRTGGWMVTRGQVRSPGGRPPPAGAPQGSPHLGHLALVVSGQKGHVVDLILDHKVLLLTLEVLVGEATVGIRAGVDSSFSDYGEDSGTGGDSRGIWTSR